MTTTLAEMLRPDIAVTPKSCLLPTNLTYGIPNRRVTECLEFENPLSDGFDAYNAAVKFLKELDYTVGIMCSPHPTAFARNVDYIAKWKNLNSHDKERIEGVIVADSFRSGSVYVVIFG